jgi:hypothetical protein
VNSDSLPMIPHMVRLVLVKKCTTAPKQPLYVLMLLEKYDSSSATPRNDIEYPFNMKVSFQIDPFGSIR